MVAFSRLILYPSLNVEPFNLVREARKGMKEIFIEYVSS